MALVLKDRVQETSTTTGTGTFTLAGAVTQFQTFSSAIGNGNTTYYTAYTAGGTDWEVGIGTVGAGTLTRDTILASSNSGNVVTFGAGTKYIFCDYPAGNAVYTDASGSISQSIVNISGITGDISTPNSLTLDTTAAATSAVGKIFWDDGDGVMATGLKGGNVTLQTGTQEYARVYNDSGSSLTKGQVVYISGAQGNRVAVKLARADLESTSFGTIGLVAETIANGAEGFVIVSGALYKINTNGLTAGTTVYLSPTTAGAFTTTKPQAPDQLVVLGWVERVDNIVGSIYVKIDNGYELDELHDVRITSPQSGNVLIYDASSTPIGVWKNANITAGTAISVTNGAGSVTIANTGVTALTAGTGISLSGSTGSVTVTNSAPDQTVAISAGTGISVTGTYPNFTVTNTSPSSGGTVTSVSGTGTVNGITLTGTVTSSGSLTLGGTLSGVDLTTQVTGTLPIANGGTNSTSTPTNGGAAYGTGTAFAFTAAGTSGQVLTSNGAAAPTWQTPSGVTKAQAIAYSMTLGF